MRTPNARPHQWQFEFLLQDKDKDKKKPDQSLTVPDPFGPGKKEEPKKP